MIVQGVAAFLSAIGFAVIFRAPRNRLALAGLTGALGWIVYLVGLRLGATTTISTFAGAILVGLLSYRRDRPLVLILPGIIPLVPGTTVYQAHLAAIAGRLTEAGSLALQTVLYGAAIATGLGLARWITIVMTSLPLRSRAQCLQAR